MPFLFIVQNQVILSFISLNFSLFASSFQIFLLSFILIGHAFNNKHMKWLGFIEGFFICILTKKERQEARLFEFPHHQIDFEYHGLIAVTVSLLHWWWFEELYKNIVVIWSYIISSVAPFKMIWGDFFAHLPFILNCDSI